jgi:hypothetical protein
MEFQIETSHQINLKLTQTEEVFHDLKVTPINYVKITTLAVD